MGSRKNSFEVIASTFAKLWIGIPEVFEVIKRILHFCMYLQIRKSSFDLNFLNNFNNPVAC